MAYVKQEEKLVKGILEIDDAAPHDVQMWGGG